MVDFDVGAEASAPIAVLDALLSAGEVVLAGAVRAVDLDSGAELACSRLPNGPPCTDRACLACFGLHLLVDFICLAVLCAPRVRACCCCILCAPLEPALVSPPGTGQHLHTLLSVHSAAAAATVVAAAGLPPHSRFAPARAAAAPSPPPATAISCDRTGAVLNT